MPATPLRLLAAFALGLSVTFVAGPALAQDDKPADPPADKPAQAQDQPAQEQPQPEKPDEAPAADEPAVTARERVYNLDNPCGVAVHPKTGHVFVTSTVAIYRYLPEETDRSKKINIEVVIDPANVDEYGKGPIYKIGPLGLGFLEDGRLIVGGGGHKDGEELVRMYKIGDAAPEKPLEEAAAEQTIGPIPMSDESTTGEGNFYAVAVGKDAVYFSSNGDDTKGWVLKSELKDGKLGDLTLWLATKPLVEVDAPIPITFSPDGSELVVGQGGEVNIPEDSLLTKYDPASGELKFNAPAGGLYDLTGLAYSPKSGKLYATDFAWAEPEKGGLFQLEIEGDKVTATKVLSLDKPTAMAFDKDGRLWVTVFGTAEEGSDKSPGKLLLIEGDL
ncbi:MAG TPA: hypothetical protein VML55_12830 [Planctomycetaceae bacterium]|nr:hypothetical protein [Planctomycetaceae bacterium]